MSLKEAFISLESQNDLFPFQRLAKDKLLNQAMPEKKEEAYQYFPLLKLYSKSFSVAEKKHKHLFQVPKGMVCDFLSHQYNTFKLLLDNHYQQLISEEKDFFALSSLAMSANTLLIYVPSQVQVEDIFYLEQIIDMEKAYQSSFSNILIFLGKGSKLTMRLETKQKENIEHLFSRVISIHLGEKADLVIESDLNSLDHLWHFDFIKAQLKKEARLFFVGSSQGGLAIRQDFHVDLLGEQASATLKGLHVLKESKNAYNHVCINHKAKMCHSDQHFKQVIFDRGKAVFEGKIFVDSEAMQTDAYQLCNHLMLGDKAEAYAKPNLEIFADEVKASHGATFSQLNQEDIFYLLSRGIDKQQASELLIKGFCREITDFFSRKDV